MSQDQSERGLILEDTAEEGREGFLWAYSVKKSTRVILFFFVRTTQFR